MGISLANLDVGGIFSGLGTLAKDLREAFTGDISAEKKAELAMKVQELEHQVEIARISVMTAEAQSSDKWTSRARPAFLYVVYTYLVAAFPMGVLFAVSPESALNVTSGVKSWLAAIPPDMWVLMGAGYLGYAGVRTYEKAKGK